MCTENIIFNRKRNVVTLTAVVMSKRSVTKSRGNAWGKLYKEGKIDRRMRLLLASRREDDNLFGKRGRRGDEGNAG